MVACSREEACVSFIVSSETEFRERSPLSWEAEFWSLYLHYQALTIGDSHVRIAPAELDRE